MNPPRPDDRLRRADRSSGVVGVDRDPAGRSADIASVGSLKPIRGVSTVGQRQVIKRARRAVKRGTTPIVEVDIERRRIPALPDLFFDGSRPDEILEAARRSVADAVGVRADQIEVTPRRDEADR
jgi:hypothetical protein